MLNIAALIAETQSRITELEVEHNSTMNQIEQIRVTISAIQLESAKMHTRLATLNEIKESLAPAEFTETE